MGLRRMRAHPCPSCDANRVFNGETWRCPECEWSHEKHRAARERIEEARRNHYRTEA